MGMAVVAGDGVCWAEAGVSPGMEMAANSLLSTMVRLRVMDGEELSVLMARRAEEGSRRGSKRVTGKA